MNATCEYVLLAKLVMQSHDTNDTSSQQRRVLDLSRMLPQLRQLLSCVVCCRLLSDPYVPHSRRCQHNVCRLCIRGRKSLRPHCSACKDCQDLQSYEENAQMHRLLLCYKSLCEHMATSKLFAMMSKQRPPHPVLAPNSQATIPTPHMSTQEFVLEGANYEENTNAFNIESRPILLPRLPIASLAQQQQHQQQTPISTAAVTPSSTANCSGQILTKTPTVPKAATPPASCNLTSSSSPPLVASHHIAQKTIEAKSISSNIVTTAIGSVPQYSKPTANTTTKAVATVISGASVTTTINKKNTHSHPQLQLRPLSQLQSQMQSGVASPQSMPPTSTAVSIVSPHILVEQQQKKSEQQQQLPSVHTIHQKSTPSITTSVRSQQAGNHAPTMSGQQQQLNQASVPMFTIKHLRNLVDLSGALPVSMATLSGLQQQKQIATSSGNNNNPTITYMGGNTPGIVVPLISSAGTTTAPLSIASAKLQTLNRQLAQARQNALNNAAAAGNGNSNGTITVSTLPITVTSASTLTGSAVQRSIASASPALSVGSGNNSQSSTRTSDSSRSSMYKVAIAPAPQATTIAATTTTTSTSGTTSSTSLHNPPPIKTVSNGSAMYSVLYTGVGNKITIKRKTDGDDDATQRKNAAAAIPPSNVFQPLNKSSSLLNSKRRGCRCGNATATPGKLTCCGQRCPCYVESKSCIGCKCRGCRNPHRPDGGKVRPVIPELACYEIQMADENSSLSPHDLPIGTIAPAMISTTATCSGGDSSSTSQSQQSSSLMEHLDCNSSGGSSHISPPSAEMLHSSPVATSSTNTSTSNLLPQLTALQSGSATSTLIPLQSLQQHQQPQHHHQQQQRHLHQLHQQMPVSGASNVLLQNAEGKYQVVPLHHFTAVANSTSTQQQQQRTVPALTVTSVGNSFILSTAAANTCLQTTSVATATATTASLLPRLATHMSVNNTHTQLPLQVQQQLKQNNFITVHPIPSTQHHQQQQHQHQHQHQQQTQQHPSVTGIQLLSGSSVAGPSSSITLSPIFVGANNQMSGVSSTATTSFTTDMNAVVSSNSATDILTMKTTSMALSQHNAISGGTGGGGGGESITIGNGNQNNNLQTQIITVPIVRHH